MKEKRFTLPLPHDLYPLLKEEQENFDETMTQTILNILYKYFDDQGRLFPHVDPPDDTVVPIELYRRAKNEKNSNL